MQTQYDIQNFSMTNIAGISLLSMKHYIYKMNHWDTYDRIKVKTWKNAAAVCSTIHQTQHN
jgi:hypothetical protein